MNENEKTGEELSLKYQSKGQVSKSGFLGVFIGLAIIVPGVSGAAVAIIFKLYEKLLYAMGNLFKKFGKCFVFLLPIGIGAVIGVGGGFFGVKKLLDLIPFAIVALFAGLMFGAYPAITDQLKGEKRTPQRTVLMIMGIIIPILIAVGSTFISTADRSLENLKFYHYILFVILGYAVGVTQIVPGMSATALLMMLGYFTPMMQSIGFGLLKNIPVLLVFVCMFIGFIAGLLTFSKVLSVLLEKAKTPSFYFISGLSLGSILTMFFNPEMYEVYCGWAATGVVWWELILGMVLFAGGIFASYRLVAFERKKQ